MKTSGNGAEGIESKSNISISGGEVAVVAYDDAINSGGDLTITVTNSKAADIVATTRDTWTGGTRNGVSKAQ